MNKVQVGTASLHKTTNCNSLFRYVVENLLVGGTYLKEQPFIVFLKTQCNQPGGGSGSQAPIRAHVGERSGEQNLAPLSHI